MGRTARDNRDLPHPRPVQKIELSESNTTRRFIAAGLFLLIGAGALAYAFLQFMTPDSGWQAIQASASEGPTCGEEFVFLYELGAGELSLSAENKAVNMIYTEACGQAFRLFHTMEGFEGVVNLYEINQHPNEVLEVDEVLYNAFAAIQEAGDRTLYLGPVYARYGDLFYCTDDVQLVDFDPRLSEEVRQEYAAIAAYAADPQSIGVELLGEGKICLRVSEEYLNYAQQEEIDRFLDFGWMKNAFIVDYLADSMRKGGFTHGSITSFDGFARCLDEREGTYSLNLYDQQKGKVIQAGVMQYQGPMSLVTLRSFPATAGDEQRYYRLKSGEVRTLYLDPKDGQCRLDADSVTCYSPAHSCAELAMKLGQAYIADSHRLDPQFDLVGEGAVIIECLSQQHRFITFGEGAAITDLYENEDGVRYTVESMATVK